MNQPTLLSGNGRGVRLVRGPVLTSLDFWLVQGLLAFGLLACLAWLALCIALVPALSLTRAKRKL